MANKRHKLDHELLRIRNQSNLEKTKESLKQIIAKHGSSDPIVKLVENEVELESYLNEHQPVASNIIEAEKSLNSVKNNLQNLKNSEVKYTKIPVGEDISLLLAKINYAQGNFKTCLEVYDELESLSTFTDIIKKPLYKKRLLSEIFAIRGLSLEQIASGSPITTKKLYFQSYEASISIFLQYLVDYEKGFPSVNMMSEENIVSFFSENAIYRCTILYIKSGKLWDGVKTLRRIMKAVHSYLPVRLQQVISCKLAMILLRGTSTKEYQIDKSEKGGTSTAYDFDKPKKSDSSVNDDTHIVPATVPQSKAKFYLGETTKFVPGTLEQEVVLLLLISEIMLNVDPVLDMSPEHFKTREETLRDAETIYSLLTVACSYLGQYDMLSMSIEKSLKYAFDRHHIWQQYALSLSCSSKDNIQALPGLAECCSIKPTDIAPALIAAKICYEAQPPRIDEGLNFARLALKNSEECFESDGLKSRAYLALGVGLSLKALTCTYHKVCFSCRSEAISAYSKSYYADPYDFKSVLYQAYEFALSRQLQLAFKKVKKAIDMNPESLFAHHLLALLLTSRGQYDEAKQTIESVLEMYPQDMRLLATKCRLAQYVGDETEALRSCENLMRVWSLKPERNVSLGTDTAPEKTLQDGFSVANMSIGAELDTGSFIATSAVYSRYGPLSDRTSSLADLQPRITMVAFARSEVWLQVAEVYLELDRSEDAEQCVAEAIQVHPLLPSVLYMRGRLCEYRGELAEACAMYNNALIVEPFHLKSIEALSNVLSGQGKYGHAKKLLQNAIIQNASSHKIWQSLADVLNMEGDLEAAIECSSYAIKLEEAAPLIPFSILIPAL